MKKKLLLPVIAIIVMSAIAVAQKTTAESAAGSIYPYHYYSDDFPDILVMKGIAVKGEDVKSAIFLATDKTGEYKFKSNYLLIDGRSHKLELESSKFDENTRTAILKFTADDEVLKLVIKLHRINYQDIAIASGVFDGHILNLRFVGDYEQIYRIMQYSEPTEKPLPMAVPTSDLTAEEMSAIEEALE